MRQDLMRRLGNIEQIAYLREYTYTSGKAKGMSVIELNNGLVSMTLAVDRGLDIIDFRYMNTNLGFISKNGVCGQNIAHTDGAPFGRSFTGGFLYTCGLDNVGGNTDECVTHGSLSMVPATNLKLTSEWVGDEYVLAVEGEMHSTSLFGENLVLRRRISTTFMQDGFNLRDTLTNEEFVDQGYVMLYHFNMGYPLLDDCTKIDGPFVSTRGRTPFATEAIDTARTMYAPVDGEDERCYYHKLEGDRPTVSVINERAGLKLDIEYNRDVLDCFVEWKSMRSGDYALGMEPCTTELEDKVYKILRPGESVVNNIIITVKDIERKDI